MPDEPTWDSKTWRANRNKVSGSAFAGTWYCNADGSPGRKLCPAGYRVINTLVVAGSRKILTAAEVQRILGRRGRFHVKLILLQKWNSGAANKRLFQQSPIYIARSGCHLD
jgi:hypothetical protein